MQASKQPRRTQLQVDFSLYTSFFICLALSCLALSASVWRQKNHIGLKTACCSLMVLVGWNNKSCQPASHPASHQEELSSRNGEGKERKKDFCFCRHKILFLILCLMLVVSNSFQFELCVCFSINSANTAIFFGGGNSVFLLFFFVASSQLQTLWLSSRV